MNRCRRVGLDITKRCNWRCKMCFYRWKPDFNQAYDVPLQNLQTQIDAAKNRGCNHVVAVGWGEPTLYREITELIKYTQSVGMSFSAIVNGMLNPTRAEELFLSGLDHFHVSVHGLWETLNKIAGVTGAASMQERFKDYLKDSKRPWRTNTTLQLDNYKELPKIVEDVIEHGAFHVVLLGFLPHYEWGGDRARDVSVSPADLRPYVQKALDICIDAGVCTTLRYHPFCHTNPKYWPYITNARYVLYDPWEWDYGNCGKNDDDLWKAALGLGESVAVQDAPCAQCAVRMHCGGWNKVYAAAHGGAGLIAIPRIEVPAESINSPGYYFEQNPVNSLSGFTGVQCP